MTLDEASRSIGTRVTYRPFAGCDLSDIEFGVITSCNSRFVFVRYGADTNSKATRPEDLTFG